MIRNFERNDITNIKNLNFYYGLVYEHHKDFTPENILCAVENNEIVGCAHLEADSTFFSINEIVDSNFEFKLKLTIFVKNELPNSKAVKQELITAILNRSKEIKNNYLNKKVIVTIFFTNDDISDIDLFLKNGFKLFKDIYVFKKDITEDIESLKTNNQLSIVQRKLDTVESKEEYLNFEKKVNKVSMSMNQLNWQNFAPKMNNYSAYIENKFVGNTMTWEFTKEHCATENIYVDPDYQGKGIGKFMLIETLKSLKSLGYKIATLSVYCDNYKAISLYQSLNYQLQSFIYEYSYEL